MQFSRFFPRILTLLGVLAVAACAAPPPRQPVVTPAPIATAAPGEIMLKGEVWADNWFAFYLGEKLVQEDSVSITTERSFNQETFTFAAAYPLQLNFIVKDYKADDTGLEYIGTARQQMGDGGFIAQFTDSATGAVVAITDSRWACLVIHEAPLDTACEKEQNPVAGQGACGFTVRPEPAGWRVPSFDDSAWQNATEYTAAEVGTKDGYDEIRWNPSAKLIWGPNLKTDNTLLCRFTVSAP